MTIPVLIAPAYNRHDMLHRMLMSVDHPVDRTLIVDNARSLILPLGSEFDENLRRIGNVVRYRPPFTTIGYGGAINLGITQTAEEPWWLWASNDVQFHPGALAKIADLMWQAQGPRIVTGGFTWAAVNRELIDVVGLVDDWSFFPIYFDDNDYQRRCSLAGVEWIEWWADGSTHGDGENSASLTILSDEVLRTANHVSFIENRDRYIEKWGGLPREEIFDHPYGNPELPLWYTKPDLAGRARRVW